VYNNTNEKCRQEKVHKTYLEVDAEIHGEAYQIPWRRRWGEGVRPETRKGRGGKGWPSHELSEQLIV
jgi:hypothetical protein